MKPLRDRGSAAAVLALSILSTTAAGQRRGVPPPVPSPRQSAPIDLTGYWVSLVTEDWRYRTSLPPKGDYSGVPLSPAGREAAGAWDEARASADGERCKPFGAASVMRTPGRLHITWAGDETLVIETDAGAQTRNFAFGTRRGAAGTWQGVSIATWDRSETVMGRGGFFPAGAAQGGSLKVITTGLKPGYLRRNGVPYSSETTLTEFFDRFDVPGGDALLVVSSEVLDPQYLSQPYWTSTHFRRQRDAIGWKPTPCE